MKNGTMWKDSYDAAALKSVVLDMKRWLPASTQLVAAIASDGEILDVNDATELGEIDHQPTTEPVSELAAGGA